MTSPTPLEIAAALRSTAEFCRDPNSPKNTLCLEAADATGDEVEAWDPRAATFCAVGFIRRQLGVGSDESDTDSLPQYLGLPMDDIGDFYGPFDKCEYEVCAEAMEGVAAKIEASIPTRVPAETQEPSHV